MGLSTAGLEMMVGLASHELMLLASIGILFIGFDDLLFDILWFVTRRRGARPLYLRDRMLKELLAGPLTIFVPAWDEAKVLPAMLRRTLSAWQAGIVGARRRDGFADAAVVVDREIARIPAASLHLGALAVGSVQPGVARVDVGPRLTLRLPEVAEGSRVALDWRGSVAGEARPGSGLALTLAADF